MLSSGPVGSSDTSCDRAEGREADALRSWYSCTPAAKKNVEVARATITYIISMTKTPADNAPVIAPNRPISRLRATNRPPAHELKPDHTARKTTIRMAT